MNEDKITDILKKYKLTSCQKDFINLILNNAREGFENQKIFTISGIAGSGKSYALGVLTKILNLATQYSFTTGTFTGKASDVLRNKGVDSYTLHSIMYSPNINKHGKITSWKIKNDINEDIIFVDEFGVLDNRLIHDLLKMSKIIVFLGDENQLGAISTDKKIFDYKLEEYIDLRMTTIVRQEEGNPIVHYANQISDNKMPKTGLRIKNDKGAFATFSSKDVDMIEKAKNYCDLIVVGANKMRAKLNEEIRDKKGYTKLVEKGEVMMLLRNCKVTGTFNGQTITILDTGELFEDEYGFKCINVNSDIGEVKISLDVLFDDNYDFNLEVYKNKCLLDDNYIPPLFIRHGTVVTAYKAQGTTCESVLVYTNDMNFMKSKKDGFRKSVYSAVTRASKNCFIVL